MSPFPVTYVGGWCMGRIYRRRRYISSRTVKAQKRCLAHHIYKIYSLFTRPRTAQLSHVSDGNPARNWTENIGLEDDPGVSTKGINWYRVMYVLYLQSAVPRWLRTRTSDFYMLFRFGNTYVGTTYIFNLKTLINFASSGELFRLEEM